MFDVHPLSPRCKLASPLSWRDAAYVTRPLTLWLIGDGKPGHENQSLGLAEAIAEMRPCEIHRISVASGRGWIDRMRVACVAARSLPAPDLILAAGHATHLPLWWLSRSRGARSVVLMRPSLPLAWFDLCVAPEHDFDGVSPSDKLLLTKGAINRVRVGEGRRVGRLILIGGPSKAHAWDGDVLMNVLKQVVDDDGWELTDSRRTPQGFLDRLRDELPQVSVFLHEETSPGWLPQKLQQAREVWVSEDSVSMIYEALSSGARVGLLPVPRQRGASRVLRGLDRLIAEHRLCTHEQWLESGGILPEAEPLREADRCAAMVLKRLGL